MQVSFELKAVFPVSSEILYQAFLDSKIHSAMTGGEAECNDQPLGSFTAWNGYILGRNLRLTPYTEIHQAWWTTEFAEVEEPSEVILRFKDTTTGCELTLIHTEIPEGQPDYRKGWEEHYFEPMRTYFK